MFLAGLAHVQAEAQPQSQSPDKGEKQAKAFSCLRCFERKVKCDKNHPCNNCVKSNVACHFRIPSAPRRKKKKRGTEEILLDRLKRAEDLLRSKGILVDQPQPPTSFCNPEPVLGPLHQQAIFSSLTPESPTQTGPPAQAGDTPDPTSFYSSQPPFSHGKLIVDQSGSRSRFIDNNLWSSVSGEFRDPQDAIADDSSSEEDGETVAEDDNTEFLLGLTPSTSVVSHLHPNREGMFKLWAVFLENVNPLVKIVHYPSLQEKLDQASRDIENVSRGLEALMFAIYLSAISSMEEAECEKVFHEPRKTLRARYRQGAKRALSRARFLGTADLVVLQAFVLYLLMMRPDYDSRTLWTLAGVANRMAQGMGIHRDGTKLGLPPFETEMRRRIWWQITILDFRSAELTGSGRFGDFSLSDTRVPANVNDSDIWPGMTDTQAPVDATRPTEMITCLLRCEFGAFWKEKLLQKGFKGEIHPKDFLQQTKLADSESTLGERDHHIDELERRIEDKFLKYCDPIVPLQLLASLIGRGAVNSMRLMAHHPRRWVNEAEIPGSERTLLWTLAVKLIAGDNTVHATRQLQKYKWHFNVYFQWQALIYLLCELKKHTRGEHVDAAWKQVDECWDNHPEFVTDYKKPLHVAVGSLCLKAYDERERGLREEYAEKRAHGGFVAPLVTPAYIEMLRQQRAMPRRKDTKNTLFPAQRAHNSDSVSEPPMPTDAMAFIQAPPLPPPRTGQPQAEPPMAWNTTQTPFSQDFAYDPVMMAYDPNIMPMTGMGSGDLQQMDWNQWDYLIQEFEMPNVRASGGTGT